MTLVEIKYFNYILNDLKIRFKDEIKPISILKLSPKHVKESTHIDVSNNENFLTIKYMRRLDRNGWTPLMKTLHIEKIAISNISKMDLEVNRSV
jgi:hypothetical protein